MKFFNNGCLKPELPEDLNDDAEHIWNPIFSARPQPPQRSTHATCVHQRKLYMFGGRGKYGALNDFWSFNLDNEIWEEIIVEGETPGKLQGHSMLTYDNCIYIFGGKICSSAEETTLWEYNIEGNEWTHVLCEVNVKWPSTRRLHSSVLYENAMYIYGGFQEITGPTNEMWLFDFNSCSWHLDSYASDGNNNFPSPRYEHTAIVHSENMWVCGGMTGLTASAEVWSWHFENRIWTHFRFKNGPYELSGHSAAIVGWNMYIFGGNDRTGELNQNMWRFSLWKHNWKKCSFSNFIKPELVTGQTMVAYMDFNVDQRIAKSRARSMPTLKSVKAMKVTSSSRSLQMVRRSNAITNDDFGQLFYKRRDYLPQDFSDKSSLIFTNENNQDNKEMYCYDQPIEIIDLDWDESLEDETPQSSENNCHTGSVLENPPSNRGDADLVLKSFVESHQQFNSSTDKTIPMKELSHTTAPVPSNIKRFSYNLMKEPVSNSRVSLKEAETSFITIPTTQSSNANLHIITQDDSDPIQSRSTNIAQMKNFTEQATAKPVLLKKKIDDKSLSKKFEMDFDISLLIVGGKPNDSLSSVCVDRPVKLWKCQNCKCDE